MEGIKLSPIFLYTKIFILYYLFIAILIIINLLFRPNFLLNHIGTRMTTLKSFQEIACFNCYQYRNEGYTTLNPFISILIIINLLFRPNFLLNHIGTRITFKSQIVFRKQHASIVISTEMKNTQRYINPKPIHFNSNYYKSVIQA